LELWNGNKAQKDNKEKEKIQNRNEKKEEKCLPVEKPLSGP